MTPIRTLILVTSTVLAFAAPAFAGDDDLTVHSCSYLWKERNQIYKNHGYCFKTSRAINAFGNSGCSHDDVDDVPLANWERGYIRMLQKAERQKHC